jgi:hypothetical protein
LQKKFGAWKKIAQEALSFENENEYESENYFIQTSKNCRLTLALFCLIFL